MNKQEKNFFFALSKDRSEIADVLDRRAVRGYKDSVVEKYSDQAHFIYELLQNADDADATNARFILEKNRLIFAHNGKRHFSVSNPKTEEEDSVNNTLGDINAITSIANSNKTGAAIGKFGVGFKAVFQYTQTPHIYDPNYCFKIERFIVPVLLNHDFPGRRADETLFVFPFNHQERSAEDAFEDISEKLRNLSFPLLFLTHLRAIEFEFDDILGLYDRTVLETLSWGETTAELLCLTQNAGDDLYDEKLWLFSRKDEYQRKYSVGFFLDEIGHLKPVTEPAFCFFPTKETTGLNFILHAPFLLTDSREGIRAGITHNDQMIQKLAALSADALEYLRNIGEKKSSRLLDDTILSIIPVDQQKFSDPTDKRKVSFLPFYTAIKNKLEQSELLPSIEGYASTQNAYWASVPQLTALFSNEQLAQITENPNARWVFTTIGRDEVQRNNRALYSYADSLVRTSINEDVIISGRSREFAYIRGFRQSLESVKGISAPFIEAQPIEWLHEFYKWISETKHRSDISLIKPIFLDSNRKAVAAYDDKKQLILFLPDKDITGYTVVYSDLLDNEDTRKYIDAIGIKKPSLKDQIYNIIIPQYKENGGINTKTHFKLLYKYYCKCSKDEMDEFIALVKDLKFLIYYQEGKAYRTKASSLYMPQPELVKYFSHKPGTLFVDFDGYLELVGSNQRDSLTSFLCDVGVKTAPSILETRNDSYNRLEREYSIDGLTELITAITMSNDPVLSLFAWEKLCGFIEANKLSTSILQKTIMSRPDGRYRFRTEYVPSSTEVILKTSSWLLSKTGEFVSPEQLTIDALAPKYDVVSENAGKLLSLLGIGYTESTEEKNDNLTQEQREKIALADKLKAAGIESELDLADYLEYRRQKKAAEMAPPRTHVESKKPAVEDFMGIFDESADNGTEPHATPGSKKASRKSTVDVIKDVARRATKRPSAISVPDAPSDEDTDADADEYMPPVVDYRKLIERAKEKSAAEIDKIAYYEELQDKALQLTQNGKYTSSWFNTLLEMESINSGEQNSNSKEVSISFGKVEREPGTSRTLILKHPSRYIPQFMEDLADIPLVLHMEDQTKTVAIEVANIKSYTLRVKLKNGMDIDGIDLSAVTAATIDAKSPAFLLEELRKQFAQLELADDFNMKENLCENIEFIFGPPGTGKTTHLAKNVLIPLMKENNECKVLVLTPTNKSADVLAKRIMEVSGSDTAYENWLVRFGGTSDEAIEQSSVFKDKTFDIRTLAKNVTITTIARFPYDFFMPQGMRVFLHGINWDYIVIDEASMIPIANIVFPLYKKTPKKFIIAGDPFQIEPISSVDIWKNENIYTMVELDSFVSPKTKPHAYKVELLTTQYRSVPAIGDVFSKFAYGGILQHYRAADSQRKLNVDDDLIVDTLNIIKYPVSKYESIYRPKRLQHSSNYQVYAALFTFEYVCYLANSIAKNNPGGTFKIGIIAPYRAQADLIDKLLASEKIPHEVDIQVGTIHGFQGDECDIIFAVFNTPPKISNSKEMFLNKRNIINVSISRARDYLFVVMPDDDTDGISNLHLVKRVESLIYSTNEWEECLSPDLEDLMFGDPRYLENKAFSTSHQSVNVYGLPEKRYEVRTEDNAVDIQLHKRTED